MYVKKEKKNRKKDKENGSGSGEAGNRDDIDAPDAVVGRTYFQAVSRHDDTWSGPMFDCRCVVVDVVKMLFGFTHEELYSALW